MENWAPLPKGFPQYNKSGSVRHVRELQGVMDVLSGLWLDVEMCQPHECACMR